MYIKCTGVYARIKQNLFNDRGEFSQNTTHYIDFYIFYYNLSVVHILKRSPLYSDTIYKLQFTYIKYRSNRYNESI